MLYLSNTFIVLAKYEVLAQALNESRLNVIRIFWFFFWPAQFILYVQLIKNDTLQIVLDLMNSIKS